MQTAPFRSSRRFSQSHASYNGGQTVTLPNVAPGNYYLIAYADAMQVRAESNETNNTFVASITIGP